jgi:ATP-dependent helicase/nuclease subunit B
MAVERHFLGWDAPALPRAAAWLRERYLNGHAWDLSGVAVVMPTGRSGRRLIELLVEMAADAALTPPRVLAPGGLAQLLCIHNTVPATRAATEMESQLARLSTLRGADAHLITRIVPSPPEADDLAGWWALAEQTSRLNDDLAAAMLDIGSILQRLGEVDAIPARVADRIAALAELEHAYRRRLAAVGLVDEQQSRLSAVREGACQAEVHLVLVGVVDLSPQAEAMLRAAGEAGAITALVAAPPEHATGFDELGGMRPAYWLDQRVELPEAAIRFVDRPVDQAGEVVATLADTAGADGVVAVDRVTVAMGDPQQASVIKRTLELAGVPARYGPGRPATRSRPATLLGALGRFFDGVRFADLADLLRHPDLDAFLRRAQVGADAVSDWLTLLDNYAADHLQERFDGGWLGSPVVQERLKGLWDAIHGLLAADPRKRSPLPQWSEPIAGALRRVYESQPLSRENADDHETIEALEALGDVLRETLQLDEAVLPLAPDVTVAEATALTLNRLGSRMLAEEAGGPAVELTGYLDIGLDDAPTLIITSMNEGSVPTSRNVDPILPDSVRGRLGMADNARVLARDLLLLATAANAGRSLTLLACRRSADGDPLAPSRLLLSCGDQRLVDRMRTFYAGEAEKRRTPPVLLLTPGASDRFLMPPPTLTEPAVRTLSVTAFRDYIACPYRFYLKHICRLSSIDDDAIELDALAFGNLCHDVLMSFGRSPAGACDDRSAIAAFLRGELDTLVASRYGQAPRGAVRIQVEQAWDRLEAFAARQADWAREGWRIQADLVEERLSRTISVAGGEFTIVGRIDRIDHHPQYGWRVLDYKTGDKGRSPGKTHRSKRDGVEVWVDLQLPLYRDLCEPLGVTGDVAVGYVNLPKKQGDVRLELAEWGVKEYDEARAERDRIIKAIRDGVFWPPGEPPEFDDALSRLCGDGVLDREQLVRASAAVGARA